MFSAGVQKYNNRHTWGILFWIVFSFLKPRLWYLCLFSWLIQLITNTERKWIDEVKSRNSINREIYPENFRCQLFLWPLPVISDIPPNVDAASATHSPLLRPPENSKRKGTMEQESLPGLTGKWQDWVKTGRLTGWPVSGISLPRVTGFKKVLTFSASWCDTCDKMCFLRSWKDVWRSTPSTVAAPPLCIHHVSLHPVGSRGQPRLLQVPGPALQQLLHLGPMPGCLACSPPDSSHIPGGEPRAGSEKNVVLLLLNKIIIICALIIWKRWCRCN